MGLLSYAQSIECDLLAFFSRDVFALDSVIKRIQSYPGVRKGDVLIPVSIKFHKEVIIKGVERKLADKKEGSLVAKEISNVVA